MPDQIKKSTTYDPSTGETTFRASWSGSKSSISRGPITLKPTQRTVAARQVSSPASRVVASRSNSEGQRIAVAFKSPTAAGTTEKAEIKAGSLPDKKVTPKLTRGEVNKMKIEADNESLKSKYPGMSIEDARAKRYKERTKAAEKSAKESSFRSMGTGDGSEKQKSATCTRC